MCYFLYDMKLILVLLFFILPDLIGDENHILFSEVLSVTTNTLLIKGAESKSSVRDKKSKAILVESLVNPMANQSYSLVKKNSKVTQPEGTEAVLKKNQTPGIPYISRAELLGSQAFRKISSVEIKKSVDGYLTAISDLCKKSDKMNAEAKLLLFVKSIEDLEMYIEEKISDPLKQRDAILLTSIFTHIQSEKYPYKEIMKEGISSAEQADVLKNTLEQNYRLAYKMGEAEKEKIPPWMVKILKGLSCIADEKAEKA